MIEFSMTIRRRKWPVCSVMGRSCSMPRPSGRAALVLLDESGGVN